ncbi:MAG: LysM peptidoglycan-binding domain-containing protein [Spirochaetaceae bacterium]|jgi:tetratricopeptide (TPR) repeat protein|nr:LysM peptidoglycan-binding domain-containing protein [Spirochaetaceae bacterium]
MKSLGLKRLTFSLALMTQICFSTFAAITDYDAALNNVRRNTYLDESLRLQKMADRYFAAGDYDRAVIYAADAIRSAAVSDMYVKQQVKIYVANDKMSAAERRLAWADMSEAKRFFPSEFYEAKTYYNLGLIARDAKKWDDTINNADKVIETLAAVAAPPENLTSGQKVQENVEQVQRQEQAQEQDKKTPMPSLPSQYIVRPWDKYGDCFWNIAGRSWAYGDPRRWPILYQANRKKLPDPDNPNLIEPGMIMDIPSVNGEVREGLWDSGKTYSPIEK